MNFILAFIRSKLVHEEKKYNVSDEELLSFNQQVTDACKQDDIKTVEKLLNTNWNNISLTPALNSACTNARHNIVNYLISRGARSWRGAFNSACESGDVDLVKLIESKEKEELQTRTFSNDMIDFSMKSGHIPYCGGDGFECATLNGHKNIVEYLLSRPLDKSTRICPRTGTILQDEYNIDFNGACLVGRRDIIDELITDGENDWDNGLRYACCGGHLEIVQLMIQHGADDWNTGLGGACLGGHLDIVQLMIQHGANDWNAGLREAYSYEIIKLMISHGANNLNEAMANVCMIDEKRQEEINKILEFLVIKGATNVRPLVWCRFFDLAVIVINQYPEVVTDDTILNGEKFLDICNIEDTMHLLNKGATNLETTHSLNLSKIRNEKCLNFKNILNTYLYGRCLYYDFHCLDIICEYIEYLL